MLKGINHTPQNLQKHALNSKSRSLRAHQELKVTTLMNKRVKKVTKTKTKTKIFGINGKKTLVILLHSVFDTI